MIIIGILAFITLVFLTTLAIVNCSFIREILFGGLDDDDDDEDGGGPLKTHLKGKATSRSKGFSAGKNLFPYVPGGAQAKAPPALKMADKNKIVVNNPYLLWNANNPKNNGLILIDNAAWQEAIKNGKAAGLATSNIGSSSSDNFKIDPLSSALGTSASNSNSRKKGGRSSTAGALKTLSFTVPVSKHSNASSLQRDKAATASKFNNLKVNMASSKSKIGKPKFNKNVFKVSSNSIQLKATLEKPEMSAKLASKGPMKV